MVGVKFVDADPAPGRGITAADHVDVYVDNAENVVVDAIRGPTSLLTPSTPPLPTTWSAVAEDVVANAADVVANDTGVAPVDDAVFAVDVVEADL